MTRRAKQLRSTPRTTRRKRTSNVDPVITISEEQGVRYLHFGNEWIQGAMRVRKPWTLELDYSRHMMAWLLFLNEPLRILQLGLGAGSLTRFCMKFFPQTEIHAVDNSLAVWMTAQSQFRLPANNERFEVVIEDGHEFISQPHRFGYYDVLQVDVFDAQVRGPVLNSQPFYNACAKSLTSDGILVVNLFGEQSTSYNENVERIKRAFNDQVLLLPPVEAGNIIVLASHAPFNLDWPTLYDRAKQIDQSYDLNAKGWVNGLKSSVS